MKCEEKRKYRSKFKAAKGIKKVLEIYNTVQYAYKCANCGYYHLTSNSPDKEMSNAKKRQQDRIFKEAEHWKMKFKIAE